MTRHPTAFVRTSLCAARGGAFPAGFRLVVFPRPVPDVRLVDERSLLPAGVDVVHRQFWPIFSLFAKVKRSPGQGSRRSPILINMGPDLRHRAWRRAKGHGTRRIQAVPEAAICIGIIGSRSSAQRLKSKVTF